VNLDRFIVPTTVRTGTAALLAAWLAAWLAGCGPEPEPAASVEQPGAAEAGEASSLAPGEHAWKTADGNRMPYTVAGRGAATVVLVHCWMCERTFWSEQVPVLARHYRVLALDLPGHGEATAEREAWTVAGFGQDVAELIEGLGLSEVVLVGHSMGGPVSLRAAAIAGDRVRGIVAVDTLHDAEFEYAGEEIEQYLQAFETNFVGTCNRFVEQMFPEPGAEAVMERVRKTSCRADRAGIAAALMRDFGRVDTPQWFRDAGVPIRAINAAGGMPTRIEVNRQYADFDAVTLEGVGHYLHMTRPEQFNPLLLDAIADILNPEAIAAVSPLP